MTQSLLTARFQTYSTEHGLRVGWAQMRVEDHVEFEAHLAEALAPSTLRLFAPVDARDAPLDTLRVLASRRPGQRLHILFAEAEAGSGGSEKLPAKWPEIPWAELWQLRQPVWAIIDAVAWPEILPLMKSRPDRSICLYTTPDSQKQAAAPWLVRMVQGEEIPLRFKALPDDRHGGILFSSDKSADELRRHFRRFTLAWLPDRDAAVYFRFYDPRVFMDMTEALKPGHLAAISATVDAFYLPRSADNPDMSPAPGKLGIYRPPQAKVITGNFRIDAGELERFNLLNQRRFALRIARKLAAAAGRDHGLDACNAAALSAIKVGARFGMTSKAQVSVLARAVLFFGADFDRQYVEAARILAGNDLAFQRKDQLLKWIAKMLAQNARRSLVQG